MYVTKDEQSCVCVPTHRVRLWNCLGVKAGLTQLAPIITAWISHTNTPCTPSELCKGWAS